MYFWNIKALKNQLTKGSFSESDSFKYFLVLSLIGSIPIPRPPFFSDGKFIHYVLGTIIFLCGIIYCYRKNGGAAGKDFLSRFFSLNLVVFIRFSPILIISGLIIFSDIMKSIIDIYQKAISLSVVYAVSILIFYRIGYHISDIAACKVLENNES